MTLDVKLLYFFNNLTGKFQIFDTLVVFLASYLEYSLVAVFFLFLYFSGYSRQEKIHIFWTTAISVSVARLGITEIIRLFFHRPRPFAVLQVHQLFSENEWSFPSGHSAFFFAMAMAIYLYNKKWGVWFFVGAILMNLSRIITGVHYPSDILGGIIVGILVAYATFYLVEKRDAKV